MFLIQYSKMEKIIPFLFLVSACVSNWKPCPSSSVVGVIFTPGGFSAYKALVIWLQHLFFECDLLSYHCSLNFREKNFLYGSCIFCCQGWGEQVLVRWNTGKELERKTFAGGCPRNNMDECDPKCASWMVRKIDHEEVNEFCLWFHSRFSST